MPLLHKPHASLKSPAAAAELNHYLHMEPLCPWDSCPSHSHDDSGDQGPRGEGISCERHPSTLVLQDQGVLRAGEPRVPQQLPYCPVLQTPTIVISRTRTRGQSIYQSLLISQRHSV